MIRYPDSGPADVLAGTAMDGVDISAYVDTLTQSSRETTIGLRWHSALYGAGQPRPNEVVEIRLNATPLWIGIVDAVRDYGEMRGDRKLSLTARSRDATPQWRDQKRVTELYPITTETARIARDVAESLGLTAAEYDLPIGGNRTVHQSVQLADSSAWQMLTDIYQAELASPYVDALGVLRTYSRDITRGPDQVLPSSRVISISASTSSPPVSHVQVKWLDPSLSKDTRQDQALATVNMHVGFFAPFGRETVYWSEDHTQRAEGTYMVVQQSCNDGLLPVGTEEYDQKDNRSGEVSVRVSAWVPALAGAGLAAYLAKAKVPDKVQVGASGSGFTIPTGRIAQAASEAAILLVLMAQGTLVAEIRGRPYDYIHAVNTTEAYDDSAPDWRYQPAEIRNDLIANEAAAQALAVGELLYQQAQATPYQVQIVDDPRIEPGDILGLPGGDRLFVTDYSRDLGRGSAAVLSVQGFRA